MEAIIFQLLCCLYLYNSGMLGLYALENKDCIPSTGADRLYTVPQVYRLPARAVTSRLDGIPQSGGVGKFAHSRYTVFRRPKS